jgi:anti-sigma B factor antagonist
MHFKAPQELGVGGAFPAPRSVRPGGRTVVRLRGDLGFTAASAVRERLIVALHRGTDLLVLDLSDVSTCDAAGLAVLIATQRRARLLGITMRLAAPSLAVSKVLGATGLRGNFTICSDMSVALAADWHEPARLA